jgi:hypothetical protein
MRVPFKTESDAFRVAVALGLLAGLSILVGWVASEPYGVVVFAAGVAAGVTFELAGRETGGVSSLQEAAAGAHPHGVTGGKRRVLVIAEQTLRGRELCRQLQGADGAAVELDVLAPVMASRSHHWASDVDRERREAQARLEASLAWAAEQGFAARGEVGDADPLVAIEDELRDAGAAELIIVTDRRARESWLARRMLGHLIRELQIPVRELVVEDEQHGSTTQPEGTLG